MPQNIIQDLTDRVSALEADVGRWQANAGMNADAASRAEAEAERYKTRLSICVGERDALQAEVEALSETLRAAGLVPELVEEIKIEARNNLS